jgi:hypothetical protein
LAIYNTINNKKSPARSTPPASPTDNNAKAITEKEKQILSALDPKDIKE